MIVSLVLKYEIDIAFDSKVHYSFLFGAFVIDQTQNIDTYVCNKTLFSCNLPKYIMFLRNNLYPFQKRQSRIIYLNRTEIVGRVCARESPPFRPVVGVNEVTTAGSGGGGAAVELLELAARCWAEAPDDRPSFDTINVNYIK